MITAEQEPIRLAEARLFESRALARAGQPEAALTSARLGIEAFERGLATIDAGELTRISALEPVWALYAEAARLALDSQPRGVSEAFALSERGRARTLLDLNRLTPLALSEAQRRLHPHQAVLVVDQSPDTLLTWWITRDDVAVNRTELSAAALARLVERHRRSIDRGARHDEASAELHGIALARRPPQVTAIAVVADGSWNHVAWPALWDRTTNREVVRDLSIVISPSVSLALRAAATDTVPLDRALIVAAPLVSGARPLPGARLEARDIAAIYRGARLLDGDAATAEGVLNASAESAIVHVSSHAVDVPAYPQMSHLVLAGGSESRHLYVKDVARMALPHTRVVVLAACATAGRRAIRGEGSIGMAWGFLTAGVPQVVATLQEIEDAPARTFFIRLHQHLGAGLSAPAALRATQRELADAGESPRTWAVVVAMGRL
jgi:CHAT domain-containing protein